MEQTNHKVIGSYSDHNQVLTIVKELNDLGYSSEDITLYTNQEAAVKISRLKEFNVSTEVFDENAQNDSASLWEQIKHTFSYETYDHSPAFKNQDYSSENDVLYPYRKEIQNDYIVVVVNNYNKSGINATPSLSNEEAEPQSIEIEGFKSVGGFPFSKTTEDSSSVFSDTPEEPDNNKGEKIN